jgi:hypothetical protein
MGGVTRVSKALALSALLALMLIAPTIDGYQSGKPNSSSGCGTCHGSAGGVTPSLNGLPSDYTPGAAYSLTIGGTGTPAGSKGGFSLTVNNGVFSNPGTNAKIVSNSPTHSNTNSRSWTVTWTAPTQGSGTATFGLAVNFVNGNLAADAGDNWGTMSTNVGEGIAVNNAPTATNVVILPNNPSKATGLSVSYTYADSDGDLESGTEIRWTRDGNLIASLNDMTSVGGGFVTRGQDWSVEVAPSDGVDLGTSVSAGPVTIQNSVPTASYPGISPPVPVQNENLNVNYSYSDLDADLESGSVIRWYLDGNRIVELDDSSVVSELMTRIGDEWHYTVAPSDGTDIGTMVTSQPVTILSSNSAPTLSFPSLSPIGPSTDEILLANWVFNDVDGDSELDFEIEWLVFGVSDPYASHDGLVLPASATTKGQVWSFRARAFDGLDWSEWVTSPTETIVNSVPVADNLVVSPTNATSADNLTVTYDYSDADGDAEAWTTIQWYRDGVRQSLLDGETTVPSSETARGEVWQAKVTPKDGNSWGQETSSILFTIGNSAPRFNSLAIGSAGAEMTSLDELVLSMEISDTDTDPVQLTISWLRDDYHVPGLDGESTVPTEWLEVGQVWIVEVILNDGQGGTVTQESAPATITNIPPTADFTFPSTPMTDSDNPLDGSVSTDPDGGVVGWLWEWHDGSVGHTSEGSSIELRLPLGITNVKLTVFDAHGGSSNITKAVTTAFGPTVSAIEAGVSDGEVTLSWGWTGAETEFVVYRMSVPAGGSTTGWTELAKVSESGWSESLPFTGESTYRVTATVDGVENGRAVVGENQVLISLSAEDIPEPVREGISGGAQVFMLVLFILATLAALGSATIERILGGAK